jgi:hypothetical protein
MAPAKPRSQGGAVIRPADGREPVWTRRRPGDEWKWKKAIFASEKASLMVLFAPENPRLGSQDQILA